MGSKIGIICNNCDYAERFTIGIGMAYSPFNLLNFESQTPMLLELIQSKKTFETIKKLIQEKSAELDHDYGHAIYRCKQCGDFHERFSMKLLYEDKEYEPQYECSSCNGKLEKIELDESERFENGSRNFKEYPCPECGEHTLQEDELFYQWD